MPLEAAAAISKELAARVKASLERRAAKEAEFEGDGQGAWDEEDSELLEEEIAPEEVCNSNINSTHTSPGIKQKVRGSLKTR